MAIRVTRGLFRLWVVLAVLWIAGVGAITWRTVAPQGLPPGYTIDPPAKVTPAVGMFDDLVRNALIIRGIKIALIPPFLVLLIGSAFVWVFRGFR